MKRSTSYFAPWSFSHRGPLAGLAASPLVFLSGAKVPKTMPDQPWVPFDPEGFAAYRIAMSAMAATSLLVLFGVATVLLNSQAGLFTIALASLSPFVLHEVYFTWPKLHATAFVLMAFHLLLAERVGWAGLLLGIGYLFHPLALFSLPILWLVWVINKACKKTPVKLQHPLRYLLVMPIMRREIMTGGIRMVLLIGLVMLMWGIVNGGHFKQVGFLNYFAMVDGHPALDVFEWLKGRAVSISNTIIPLHLYIFHADNPAVNSIFEKSPNIIVFFFQYWNTLPFSLGLTSFVLVLVKLYRGAKNFPFVFTVTIILPFVIFSIYWGAFTTGMMREGLHVWVFSIFLFITWSLLSANKEGIQLSCWQSALFALRAVEIVLMLLLPTLLTTHTYLSPSYTNIDLIMLTIMVLGVGWLGWYSYLIGRTPISKNNEAVMGHSYLVSSGLQS